MNNSTKEVHKNAQNKNIWIKQNNPHNPRITNEMQIHLNTNFELKFSKTSSPPENSCLSKAYLLPSILVIRGMRYEDIQFI